MYTTSCLSAVAEIPTPYTWRPSEDSLGIISCFWFFNLSCLYTTKACCQKYSKDFSELKLISFSPMQEPSEKARSAEHKQLGVRILLYKSMPSGLIPNS